MVLTSARGRCGPLGAGLLAVALSTSVGPTALQGQESTLVEQWLEAGQRATEEGATAADVDAEMALLAPDAVYEHPRVGARIAGRDAIRAGRMAFLGQTRNPQRTDVRVMEGVGVFVVSMVVSMEARTDSGWVPVERHSVVVLEHEGGLIRRIIDHW